MSQLILYPLLFVQFRWYKSKVCVTRRSYRSRRRARTSTMRSPISRFGKVSWPLLLEGACVTWMKGICLLTISPRGRVRVWKALVFWPSLRVWDACVFFEYLCVLLNTLLIYNALVCIKDTVGYFNVTERTCACFRALCSSTRYLAV